MTVDKSTRVWIIGLASVAVVLSTALFFLATGSFIATVGPGPPPDTPMNVSLFVSPTSGSAPLTLSFETNVSGGTPPYSYYLGFGDGNNSTSSTGQHTYTTSGLFTVGLTMTDADNETAFASAAVNVSGGPPPTSVPKLGFLVYNSGLADWIVDNSGYLRAGDAFYLQSGAGNNTPNVGDINTWAEQIHSVDPGGIFVAQSATLAHVRTVLKGGLSPIVTYYSLELTPSSVNPPYQSKFVDELQNFTPLVRPYDLTPTTYVTGKGIDGGWNYTLFGELVDHTVIETQHACASDGSECALTLHNEWVSAGLNTTTLSLQRTLGVDTLSEDLSMYNATQEYHLGYLFLEFAGGNEGNLSAFLQAVDR